MPLTKTLRFVLCLSLAFVTFNIGWVVADLFVPPAIDIDSVSTPVSPPPAPSTTPSADVKPVPDSESSYVINAKDVPYFSLSYNRPPAVNPCIIVTVNSVSGGNFAIIVTYSGVPMTKASHFKHSLGSSSIFVLADPAPDRNEIKIFNQYLRRHHVGIVSATTLENCSQSKPIWETGDPLSLTYNGVHIEDVSDNYLRTDQK